VRAWGGKRSLRDRHQHPSQREGKTKRVSSPLLRLHRWRSRGKWTCACEGLLLNWGNHLILGRGRYAERRDKTTRDVGKQTWEGLGISRKGDNSWGRSLGSVTARAGNKRNTGEMSRQEYGCQRVERERGEYCGIRVRKNQKTE